MSHTRLWAAAAIIASIVIVGFIISVPSVGDGASVAKQAATATTVPTVTLRDTFKKGVHTITGSVDAPNVCSRASSNATLTGDASSTERIHVAITLSVDEGICLQVPTSLDFSTTVTGQAGLPITAAVNGMDATTTVL